MLNIRGAESEEALVSTLGVRWNGIEERPLDGMRRLRATSASLLGLLAISIATCSAMVLVGTSPVLYLLSWSPVIIYLYFCSVWSAGLPGFVVWRSFTVDRVWSNFWLDMGNLGVEVESGLSREMVPFRKECHRSYFVHYRLPEGLRVGVMRFFNDRTSEKVYLLVEGVNEENWDLARDVLGSLDAIDIDQVSVHGRPVSAPMPWGFTSRA